MRNPSVGDMSDINDLGGFVPPPDDQGICRVAIAWYGEDDYVASVAVVATSSRQRCGVWWDTTCESRTGRLGELVATLDEVHDEADELSPQYYSLEPLRLTGPDGVTLQMLHPGEDPYADGTVMAVRDDTGWRLIQRLGSLAACYAADSDDPLDLVAPVSRYCHHDRCTTPDEEPLDPEVRCWFCLGGEGAPHALASWLRDAAEYYRALPMGVSR